MRFKTYLNENADPFANLAKYVTHIKHPKSQQRFLDALKLFSAGLAGQEIYNAEYKDNYSYGFSRGLETIHEMIRNSYPREIFTDSPDSLFSVVSSTKWAKHFSKLELKKKYPEMAQFVADVAECKPKINELKANVKSGRKPKPIKPGQEVFVKPLPKRDSITFMKKINDELTKAVRAKYKRSVIKTLNDLVKEVEKSNPTWSKYRTEKNPNYKMIMQKFFTLERVRPDEIIQKRKDFKEAFDKEVEYNVGLVFEQYLQKLLDKLSLIIEKKDGPTYELLGYNIRGRSLEARLRFKFADGSRFDFTTSIVYGWRQSGTQYVQYPGRFTNVTMADGSKMKMPSEEKMIKTF